MSQREIVNLSQHDWIQVQQSVNPDKYHLDLSLGTTELSKTVTTVELLKLRDAINAVLGD